MYQDITGLEASRLICTAAKRGMKEQGQRVIEIAITAELGECKAYRQIIVYLLQQFIPGLPITHHVKAVCQVGTCDWEPRPSRGKGGYGVHNNRAGIQIGYGASEKFGAYGMLVMYVGTEHRTIKRNTQTQPVAQCLAVCSNSVVDLANVLVAACQIVPAISMCRINTQSPFVLFNRFICTPPLF